MQTRCSKNGCKKHEKCSKMEPEWEPKSRKNKSKTRSENQCEKGDDRADAMGGSAGGAGAPSRLIIISTRPVLWEPEVPDGSQSEWT